MSAFWIVSHSKVRCVVVWHYYFNFQFFDNMLLSIFPCAYLSYGYLFFREVSVHIICPFCNWVIRFLIEFQNFFEYSRYQSFIWYMLYKLVLSVDGLSFHFLNNLFHSSGVFKFNLAQAINFFIQGLCLWCCI